MERTRLCKMQVYWLSRTNRNHRTNHNVQRTERPYDPAQPRHANRHRRSKTGHHPAPARRHRKGPPRLDNLRRGAQSHKGDGLNVGFYHHLHAMPNMGSPSSCSRSFHAWKAFPTAQSPDVPCDGGTPGVAFRHVRLRRHSDPISKYSRGSIAGSHVLLPTPQINHCRNTHGSGPVWFAKPSPYDSFIRNSSPVIWRYRIIPCTTTFRRRLAVALWSIHDQSGALCTPFCLGFCVLASRRHKQTTNRMTQHIRGIGGKIRPMCRTFEPKSIAWPCQIVENSRNGMSVNTVPSITLTVSFPTVSISTKWPSSSG